MSFIVRVAEPTEYTEAGLVTADAYRIDDLLRRADGLPKRSFRCSRLPQ